MVPENRPDTHEFDERLVDAIREAPMPVVNTQYLVRASDRPHAEVVERLDRLVEEGVVDHLEVEGRGHLWWLALPYERDA
ncbi:hypothetical protein ACFPYI_21350 [Halomarina salina]|uniref:MarR family transcriptional regulator n=1 Tax=Halomarina salina TaxID=1872699 RepID=A0ABD5RTI6_9EURY|nr:hypothetical protein [Halomarina salina]